MDEVRKLKRGLKDISPFFEKEEPVIQRQAPRNLLPVEASIQLISLAHPKRSSSLSLYRWIADQTAKNGYPASVVSLGPEISSDDSSYRSSNLFRHRRMELSEFEKNCTAIMPSAAGAQEASLLFLDFPWQNAAIFEKTIALLDKIVFWASPEMEDLSQIYKWIKWTSSLNNRLECLLAYDGEEERKGSYVFEKLSDMTSRHLGVDLFWFGCHPVSELTEDSGRSIDLDLLLSHANPLTLGEKKALAYSVRAS